MCLLRNFYAAVASCCEKNGRSLKAGVAAWPPACETVVSCATARLSVATSDHSDAVLLNNNVSELL